jgi:hypothetical protein
MHREKDELVLRLVDTISLDEGIQESWDDFIRQAPAAYTADGFLSSVIPISVSCRYGQNQPLGLNLAQTHTWWDKYRNFKKIRYVCVALATDIGSVSMLNLDS